MDAAYLINGNGGWPHNVLTLPDGRQFYAGTYFSRANWLKVLSYFVDFQNNDPSVLISHKNVQKKLQQNIFSYSNWGLLGIHFIKPLYEVAIVGSDWDSLRET